MKYARMHRVNSGFTLIELLVVILIVVLVSAVALPTVLPALANRQVSEGARILQAALAGARDAAIRANAPRGIRLIPDSMLSPSGSFQSISPSVVSSGASLASSRIIYIEPAPDIAASPQQQLKFPFAAATYTTQASTVVTYSANWNNGVKAGVPPVFPFPFPDSVAYTSTTTTNCSSANSPRGVYPYYFFTNPGSNFNSDDSKGHPVLMVIEAKFQNNDPTKLPNAPADWFWNVRIGDRLRINDSGHYYTVIGPMTIPNPELYVNDGAPTASTLQESYTVGTGNPITPTPQFLFLVNGIDDDNDGYVDNEVNGVNENLNFYNGSLNYTGAGQQVIDDIFEWGALNNNNIFVYNEIEQWQGAHIRASQSSVPLTYSYTITRRPVPVPGAQEVALPGGAVIDLTTWDTSRERSRLPVDPNSGVVDIMMNQSGQVIQTTAYSTPASMSMASVFYHFWVTDRADVFQANTSTIPQLPIPPDANVHLPTPSPGSLQKQRTLITLFTRTGQVVSNSLESFDFIDAYGNTTTPYDSNTPFYQAEQGMREAK